MRSHEQMEKVRRLLSDRFSVTEVARRTGVPKSTVSRWARGGTEAFGPRPQRRPWRPADEARYVYLLGLYLGDGHVAITRRRRVSLRLFLDAIYPGVVREARAAMESATPTRRVTLRRMTDRRLVILSASGRHWLEAFPQHGPGRKHEREIHLEPWQDALVRRYPRQFIRGLIHSDGCRTTNRFKTKLPSGRVAAYAYPRYFFSNLSGDILRLFCDACERLGIHWTLSNHRNVSISHRHSVARLDEFVGPKT